MKQDLEKTNRRLGKLETAVLTLFGVSLVAWIANKFINIDWLFTLSIAALFVASIALFVLVLMALLQKKAAPAKKRKK